MERVIALFVLAITIVWIIICLVAHYFDPGLQKLCDDLGKFLLAVVGVSAAVLFVLAAGPRGRG